MNSYDAWATQDPWATPENRRKVTVTITIPHVPDYIEDTEVRDGVADALQGHTEFCDEATITVRSQYETRGCFECGALNVSKERRFLFWLFDVDVTNHDGGCRYGAYLRGEYDCIGG